ncbi:MAG TPA: YgiT-type zinc finger protein [Chthonomonadaceae bacterium]|nr:YgiT-type zinc finger protein [Chthonomonadaceae bacterium]
MNPIPATTRVSSLCLHCGSECTPQMISMMLRRSQIGFVLLQNVPADVCQTCGEPQFSIATTGQVMAVLNTERSPDDMAVVPIYNLAVRDE